VARENVVKDLEKGGYLVRKEAYTHNVGKCYRCKTDIEPFVSTQWFVSTKPLAKMASAAVIKGQTRIVPKMWEGTYFDWLDNIRDWCISRQIWWVTGFPSGTAKGAGRSSSPRKTRRMHEVQGRQAPSGRRRARHLVQLSPLALLHARLAREDPGAENLLPDDLLVRGLTFSSSGWHA